MRIRASPSSNDVIISAFMVQETARTRPGLRERLRGKTGALVAAAVLQVIVLAAAVFVIVRVSDGEAEPAFKASSRISLPQRELNHRASLLEFEQAAGVAMPVPALQVEQMLPDAVPELPALPMDSFNPLAAEVSLTPGDALLGTEGLEAAIGGLGLGQSQVDLFGIREAASRLVILIDTSNSMFERQRDGEKYRFDFGVIKGEVSALIMGLQPDTQFNLAIYEGGSLAWQPELMVATLENKQAAVDWLLGLSESPGASISGRSSPGPKLLEGGGTRLDTGLKQAFGFAPDVIFIVTDGEINRSGRRIEEADILAEIRSLQAGLDQDARLHVIHYETAVTRDVELATMRAIAGRNGGRFHQVKAEPLSP